MLNFRTKSSFWVFSSLLFLMVIFTYASAFSRDDEREPGNMQRGWPKEIKEYRGIRDFIPMDGNRVILRGDDRSFVTEVTSGYICGGAAQCDYLAMTDPIPLENTVEGRGVLNPEIESRESFEVIHCGPVYGSNNNRWANLNPFTKFDYLEFERLTCRVFISPDGKILIEQVGERETIREDRQKEMGWEENQLEAIQQAGCNTRQFYRGCGWGPL